MQGEQLLQDPDFAQTLAKSPFKAEDLPGLSSAVSDTFQRMTPELKASLKEAIDLLGGLPVQQLEAFLRLMNYVEKNPDQYPKLVEQLESSGAFDKGELPDTYNPSLISVVKTLVGQALLKVKGDQPVAGYAKGGIASLKDAAEDVKAAGRNGDTMLAHINPFEATMLKRMGGAGTINPETGLPEFGFFSSTFGQILKVGLQVVATAVLTPFVGPIAAGAIVGGVSGLLSGQKPGDALKSALIGGVMSGIGAGFSGPGSFTENAFAGGSLFGSGPAASPLLDAMKNTSVGNSVFGGVETANSVGPEPGASLNPTSQTYGQDSFTGDNIPTPTARPTDLASPTISAKAAPISGFEKMTGLSDTYKWPLLLGGGAALIAASQAEKKNDVVKPSLLDNANDPNAGMIPALDPSKFQPAAPPSSPSVFPGGQYIESPIFPKGGYVPPSQVAQQQPFSGYDYTKIRFPSYGQQGIAAAAAGGAINGPGTGTSDSIPARLSDGEFVMTAAAVRGAGNGDRAKGAKKMYGIMHKFERMA